MNWKLETVEKKTSVANYLVLHRFGTVRPIISWLLCGISAVLLLLQVVIFMQFYEISWTTWSVYNNPRICTSFKRLSSCQLCVCDLHSRLTNIFTASFPFSHTEFFVINFVHEIRCTPWVKKTCHHTFVHIFAKYWPILKILSLAYSVENLQ